MVAIFFFIEFYTILLLSFIYIFLTFCSTAFSLNFIHLLISASQFRPKYQLSYDQLALRPFLEKFNLWAKTNESEVGESFFNQFATHINSIQQLSWESLKVFSELKCRELLHLVMRDELNELLESDFAPGPILEQRLAGHVLDHVLIQELIVEQLLFEDESESQD